MNKYKVLEGGKTCQQLVMEGFNSIEIEVLRGHILPLTEQMAEGVEFEGAEVHEYVMGTTTKERKVWCEVNNGASVKDYAQAGHETRIRVKPIVQEPILKIESPYVSMYEVEAALYEYWTNLEDEEPNYHQAIKAIQSIKPSPPKV